MEQTIKKKYKDLFQHKEYQIYFLTKTTFWWFFVFVEVLFDIMKEKMEIVL